MSVYNYNSSHKIITALILVGIITIVHFSRKGDAELDKFYENGQVKFSGEKRNQKNHGLWTWYFPDGQKMIEGKFLDGKRVGLWKQYFSTGELQMTSEYKDNHLEGILTTFDTTGNPVKTYEYRHDTIYKELDIY